MDWIQWTKDVALIWAAFQLLIIALLKRLFVKGRIKIYKSGKYVTLGYYGEGISISLQGTLRAVKKDLFIKNVTLTLKRKKPNRQDEYELERDFDWQWFRKKRIKTHAPTEVDFEEAKAQVIGSKSPLPFDILFYDTDSANATRALLERIRRLWDEKLAQDPTIAFFRSISSETRTDEAEEWDEETAKETLLSALKDNFQEFEASREYSQCMEDLKKECYWKEGTYEIEMTVETEDPLGRFTEKWGFSLTKDEVNTLSANPGIMLRETCYQPKLLDPRYIYTEFT